MKINFKEIKVFDLSGNEIPDLNLHETTANVLIKQPTASPIRNMELARKIYNEGEMELQVEDVAMIKNAIIKSMAVSDIVKEAILKALE